MGKAKAIDQGGVFVVLIPIMKFPPSHPGCPSLVPATLFWRGLGVHTMPGGHPS